VAAAHPGKLAQLQREFIRQAWRYHVFPIHAPGAGAADEPSLSGERSTFSYPAGMMQLYMNDAPHIIGRSFTISADVDLEGGRANGVLVAQGGRFSGYSFYMLHGSLAFCYNDVPPLIYTVRSSETVPAGHHLLAATFDYDGGPPGAGGWLTLSVDGRTVARGRVAHTFETKWISNTEGLDTGRDLITAVSSDYSVPDEFTEGKIAWIKFDLKEPAARSGVGR
jgi:arylsulfatase